MKSAQRWYSGRAGCENGTKERVCFRVSVWRLWTPLERLLGDEWGQGSSLLTEEGAWGNPTRSFFGMAGRCSGEASFYAVGSHCKQGELLQFPGTEFRAWPVEQILSACLAFPEKMRKVCVCMSGHATCQLLQLVLALPPFHHAMLQG